MRPGIDNYIGISHVYKCEDFTPRAGQSVPYNIPYSNNITWTHFRPSWLGPDMIQYKLVWRDKQKMVSLDFNIPPLHENRQWHQFPWPLPGMKFENGAGFDLVIDYPEFVEGGILLLEFCGFEGLMSQYKRNYALCDSETNPIWIIEEGRVSGSGLFTFNKMNPDVVISHSTHHILPTATILDNWLISTIT